MPDKKQRSKVLVPETPDPRGHDPIEKWRMQITAKAGQEVVTRIITLGEKLGLWPSK